MANDKRVIALGFFDGVHIGHGMLLRQVAERAAQLDAIPAAVTFDAHPEEVILGSEVPLLTTPAQRSDLMRRLYGVRQVIVARFDRDMMRMGWREFVTDYLVQKHGAIHLVAGHDFRFGYKGEGNPVRLKELCGELGLGCDIIEPVTLDGITVSSSYVRTLVARGEMERAAQFLGHPYTLTDEVVHGKKLGSGIGFPTINLRPARGCVLPPFGVYAVRVWVDEHAYTAAANVGVRPTVDDGGHVTVEGFLLDFNADLYGKQVRMEFCRFLRPEQKFAGVQELCAQVERDVACVREYFRQENI